MPRPAAGGQGPDTGRSSTGEPGPARGSSASPMRRPAAGGQGPGIGGPSTVAEIWEKYPGDGLRRKDKVLDPWGFFRVPSSQV
eukprot:5682224-Karenia_brevis.AAC.1